MLEMIRMGQGVENFRYLCKKFFGSVTNGGFASLQLVKGGERGFSCEIVIQDYVRSRKVHEKTESVQKKA